MYTYERQILMKIRYISGALSLILLAAAVCGCGTTENQPSGKDSGTDSVESTESSDSETTELMPDLPAYDGGGRDFRILGKMEGSMSGRWTARDITVEAQDGDVVNDAVYNRNLAIESKYNINICDGYLDMNSMYAEITKLMNAGDNDYDYIMPTIESAAKLARDGLLYDLSEIGNVDLSKPWWSAQFNNDVNIGGKSYYADGDICMTFIRASYCMLFNKKLVEDYGISDPYTMVADGKWTIDNMLAEAQKYAQDINGDDKYDSDDQVGLGVLHNHAQVFYAASGSKLVTYDDNSGFTFTGGTERSINVLDKILSIYTSKNSVINFGNQGQLSKAQKGMDQVNAAADVFGAGRMLFLAGTMNNVPTMRDMTTDFGIIPYPKYDEAQDKYYTYVQTWASGCAAITIDAKDPAASSIILEDMAYYSSKLITPAYYEKALKNKYVRDNESQAMLDIICENRTCDIGSIFNIGNLISNITDKTNSGKGDFASMIAKAQSKIDTQLQEISDLYLKNE